MLHLQNNEIIFTYRSYKRKQEILDDFEISLDRIRPFGPILAHIANIWENFVSLCTIPPSGIRL